MKYICIYIITFFRAIYSKCETKDIDNFNKELAYLTNLYNNISDYNCTENYYFELLNRNYYRVLLEYYNSLLSKADILRAECVSPDNDTTITTIDNAKTGLNSKKTILESNHNDKQTCMSVNQLVAGNHCYNKQYKGYLPSKKSDDVMITRHVDAKLDTIAPFILTDDKFSSSFNTAEIYIGYFYYGGISIGVCEHENCESSIFNGINIAYFGDNCYHVDYFIINEYRGTKRTCLSKYELYHLYFKIEGSTFSIGLEKEVPDYYFYSAKVDNHVSICGSLLNKMTTLKIIRTYLLSKFLNVHLYHKLQSNY